MKDPYLLHIFSPTKYVSPFDINMAYEAHYDAVIPYCNVTLEEIQALTQDTVFSRSPEGVRRTGIFIGGRDLQLALDMLGAARQAMVPPFAVSVLADPSGAITTAAAMVAFAERCLAKTFKTDLTDKSMYIFGGTGPVGACVARSMHSRISPGSTGRVRSRRLRTDRVVERSSSGPRGSSVDMGAEASGQAGSGLPARGLPRSRGART